MPESVAEFFQRHDAARVPELLPLRYHRMQADALAFFRGSAPLFYARFGHEPLLGHSPAAWLCGDAHVENFGSFRGDNRLVYFDLNDFDEAVRGPLLWDVGRLAVSVLLAGAHFGLPPAERQAVGRELLGSYAAALAAGKALFIERPTATGVVRKLLKTVGRRRRRDLVAALASHRGGGWHLRHTPVLHPLPPAERAAVRDALETWRAAQPAPPFGRVLDVARRAAGVGSLGVVRYAVLAQHHRPHKWPVLLDVKQALPAAAAADAPQPAWPTEAHRVVQVQTWLQAVPPALLQVVELEGCDMVLRALQPVADKLDFDHFTHSEAAFRAALPDFGRLLAWAHLRAAGRRGAAGPDELQAYGAAAEGWINEVLRFATQAVAEVREDYHEFRAACRASMLPTGPQVPAYA